MLPSGSSDTVASRDARRASRRAALAPRLAATARDPDGVHRRWKTRRTRGSRSDTPTGSDIRDSDDNRGDPSSSFEAAAAPAEADAAIAGYGYGYGDGVSTCEGYGFYTERTEGRDADASDPRDVVSDTAHWGGEGSEPYQTIYPGGDHVRHDYHGGDDLNTSGTAFDTGGSDGVASGNIHGEEEVDEGDFCNDDCREFVQETAEFIGLPLNEVFVGRVRVDRRGLEFLIKRHEAKKTKTHFFEKMSAQTNTRMAWQQCVKSDSYEGRGPFLYIAGLQNNVIVAKKTMKQLMDSPELAVKVRMEVCYKYHAHIIGRRGSIVRQAMEESGAEIHVSDGLGAPHADRSSQVALWGKLANVEKARQLIRNLLPLSFYFDLPLPDPTSENPLPEPDVMSRFVQGVQNYHKVKVHIHKYDIPCKQMYVWGVEQDAHRIIQATICLIHYYLGSNVPAEQVDVYNIVEIPLKHQLIVLGMNSSNIKHIMNATGTYIVLPTIDDAAIYGNQIFELAVWGPIKNVYLARQMLVGSLPFVLHFEIPEEFPFNLLEAQKMVNDLGVTIVPLDKQRSGSNLIAIEDVERNASSIYEAWCRLTKLRIPEVVVQNPLASFIQSSSANRDTIGRGRASPTRVGPEPSPGTRSPPLDFAPSAQQFLSVPEASRTDVGVYASAVPSSRGAGTPAVTTGTSSTFSDDLHPCNFVPTSHHHVTDLPAFVPSPGFNSAALSHQEFVQPHAGSSTHTTTSFRSPAFAPPVTVTFSAFDSRPLTLPDTSTLSADYRNLESLTIAPSVCYTPPIAHPTFDPPAVDPQLFIPPAVGSFTPPAASSQLFNPSAVGSQPSNRAVGPQPFSPHDVGPQPFSPHDVGPQRFTPPAASSQHFNPAAVGFQPSSRTVVVPQHFTPHAVGPQPFTPHAAGSQLLNPAEVESQPSNRTVVVPQHFTPPAVGPQRFIHPAVDPQCFTPPAACSQLFNPAAVGSQPSNRTVVVPQHFTPPAVGPQPFSPPPPPPAVGLQRFTVPPPAAAAAATATAGSQLFTTTPPAAAGSLLFNPAAVESQPSNRTVVGPQPFSPPAVGPQRFTPSPAGSQLFNPAGVRYQPNRTAVGPPSFGSDSTGPPVFSASNVVYQNVRPIGGPQPFAPHAVAPPNFAPSPFGQSVTSLSFSTVISSPLATARPVSAPPTIVRYDRPSFSLLHYARTPHAFVPPTSFHSTRPAHSAFSPPPPTSSRTLARPAVAAPPASPRASKYGSTSAIGDPPGVRRPAAHAITSASDPAQVSISTASARTRPGNLRAKKTRTPEQERAGVDLSDVTLGRSRTSTFPPSPLSSPSRRRAKRSPRSGPPPRFNPAVHNVWRGSTDRVKQPLWPSHASSSSSPTLLPGPFPVTPSPSSYDTAMHNIIRTFYPPSATLTSTPSCIATTATTATTSASINLATSTPASASEEVTKMLAKLGVHK